MKRYLGSMLAVALVALPVGGAFAQQGAVPSPLCVSLPIPDEHEHAACWEEIANHPGCYIFDEGHHPGESLNEGWSGQCSGGEPAGRGTLTYGSGVWDTDSSEGIGAFKAGKRHGRWSVSFASGDSSEGSYVDGKRHGRWSLSVADGERVEEGPYVAGEKEGHWVERWVFLRATETRAGVVIFAVGKGSYVAGKREGHWVFRTPGWKVREGVYAPAFNHEGSYVAGKREGRWVFRRGDDCTEDDYRNGEIVREREC